MTQQNRSGSAPRQGQQGDDRQRTENQVISDGQRQQGQLTQLMRDIAAKRRDIEAVLPADIPFMKFQACLNMAIRREPRLLDCYGPSLIRAAIQSAYDGLLPDGKEAVILYSDNKVPGTTKTYRREARYQSMVYGLRKKLVQAGAVTFIDAKIVYAKEPFDYEEGAQTTLRHKPELDPEKRGDAKAVYARAVLPDATIVFDVMHRSDVMAAREVAKTKNVWDGPFGGEMWKKTVIRRLSKAIPTTRPVRDAEAEEMFPQFAGAQPALPAPPRPDRRDFQAPQLEHEQTLDLTPFEGGWGGEESDRATVEIEEQGDKQKPAKRQAKAADRKPKPAESSGEPATDDKGAAPAPAAEKPRFALPDPVPSDHDGWSDYYQGLRGAIDQLGEKGTVDDLNRERRLHQPVLEQAPDDLRTAIADAFQDAITGLA